MIFAEKRTVFSVLEELLGININVLSMCGEDLPLFKEKGCLLGNPVSWEMLKDNLF